MRPSRSDKYLVWIDCEMTGLDPASNVLLEIASVITDYDLHIIARGPDLAIRQSKARLAGMDAWNRRTHRKSGLIERVFQEGVTTAEAERQTLAFARRYCYAKSAPLCGNSVGHDKRFLAKYMPQLYAFLNYRVVDVTTIKVLAANWYGDKCKPPKKRETHRALQDIEESIAELAYYRKTLFVPS